MWRFLLSKRPSSFGDQLQARKRDALLARMSAVLLNQREHFELDKEELQRLREAEPSVPKIFEAVDDLKIKKEFRVTTDSGTLDISLKGRHLISISFGEATKMVSTTHDVNQALAGIGDLNYPVSCILKNDPPEARHVYEILIDEVYDKVVTHVGISSTDARFQGTQELLIKLVREELETAIQKTQKAHGLGQQLSLEDHHEDFKQFRNGEKLKKAVELAKKVQKHFESAVDETAIRQAKALMKSVGLSQRSSIWKLFKVLIPALPYWFVAVLTHSSLEVVVAKLATGQMNIMDLVGSGQVDLQHGTTLILQWWSGWCVIIIFGLYCADLFQTRARNIFALSIKGGVMKSILQQDFEYFDRHPAGVLQERLNRDAELLKHNMLQAPKELISETTAILSNAYAVYTMVPVEMFFTGLSPLPVIALVQFLLVRQERQYRRMGDGLGEEAAKCTIEVLKEVKTVREFSMEAEEADRYSGMSSLKASMEERQRARIIICHRLMHILHLAGEAVTLLIGIKKVADGTVRPAALVTAMMMLNCMVGGKLRGIFERVGKLAQVLEPAARVCELLESEPAIEPSKGDHQVIVQDATWLRRLASAVSESGHLLADLPERDVDGSVVVQGRKLTGLVETSGRQIKINSKSHFLKLLEQLRSMAYPTHVCF